MKTIYLFLIGLLVGHNLFSQNTFLKITLDTKLMTNPTYSLGGGGGIPSTLEKVYAHLGLCTCHLDEENNFARQCGNRVQDSLYCNSNILPYRANVWQHVVGNWGEDPQDDGVGLMTTLGNGVYTIEFYIEEYFSNPALVNTNSNVDPNDPRPVVPSSVWNPNDGGLPHVIAMVFRDPQGILTGRDDMGSDLFIIKLLSSPVVIQGSDPGGAPFPAITFVTSVGEIVNEKHYIRNNPNPLTETTEIIYTITEKSHCVIEVVNIQGQKVATLFEGQQTSGSHKLHWDGTCNNGSYLSNGVYLLTIKTNKGIFETSKLVIKR